MRFGINRNTLQMEMIKDKKFNIPLSRYYQPVNQRSPNGFTICQGRDGDNLLVRFEQNAYKRFLVIHGPNMSHIKTDYISNFDDLKLLLTEYNPSEEFMFQTKNVVDAIFRQINFI